jgi:NAD(P)-dependent dehydrogenase (short-subunit alcohol dehydrogenase family)
MNVKTIADQFCERPAVPASSHSADRLAARWRLSDFFELTKPRVMLLAVFTAIVGLISARAQLDPLQALVAVLSIAAGAGAAGALNMWYDADIDAVMTRTAMRPIPRGRVSKVEALVFGVVLGAIAVMALALATNLAAAALLACTILFYAVALTARLIPLLRRASGPRVVSVSSLAHRTGSIDFNDLQGVRVYSPWKAYGQSKLACLMFALELQRRSDAAGWKLISNAAHPGFARTNLFTSGPGGLLSMATDFAAPFFGHSAADGARPILFAATSPATKPAGYYGPGGIAELRGAPARALIMPRARDEAAAARLWTISEQLTGNSLE